MIKRIFSVLVSCVLFGCAPYNTDLSDQWKYESPADLKFIEEKVEINVCDLNVYRYSDKKLAKTPIYLRSSKTKEFSNSLGGICYDPSKNGEPCFRCKNNENLRWYALYNESHALIKFSGDYTCIYSPLWDNYRHDRAENAVGQHLKIYKNIYEIVGSSNIEEIQKAKSLIDAGWFYTMPRPKSPQASWFNSDGRTTWFGGYWYNYKTNEISGEKGWSRGGSPIFPTRIEWLCSFNRNPELPYVVNEIK